MIESSIMVTMQYNTTFATIGSLRQKHLCHSATTTTSHATTSCLWIQQDLSTACDSFVEQHPDECSPSCVADALCDATVLDHAFDVQLLDGNRAILHCQVLTQFMQEISSAIGNLHMLSLNEKFCFGTIPATFFLSAQATLQSPQPFLTLPEISRIDNLATIGQRSKAFKPDIDSNLCIARMFDLWLINFAGQDSIPLVSSLLDSQSLDLAFRQSMEHNRHRTNLGALQSLVTQELETTLRVCDATNSALEPRKALLANISLAASEEVIECLAQSVGTVLQDLRMNLFDFRSGNLDVLNDRVHIKLLSQHELLVQSEQGIVYLFAQSKLFEKSSLMYSRRIDTILEHLELHWRMEE